MLPAIAKVAAARAATQPRANDSRVSWAVPVVGLAAVILGYKFVYKPWQEKRRAQSNLNKDHGSTVKAKPGKVLYDLNGKPVKSMNLGTIAADIYDTLEAWGPNDGKRVVRVFKTTPFGHVRALEKLYLDKYGKNLKDHMVKELKDEDWIAVKYWFQ